MVGLVGSVGVGVGGAPVLAVTAADAMPVLPAASVALAVRLCEPVARAPVVKLHAPLLLAVAVPIWVVPSYTPTVLFASAVPVRFKPPLALFVGVPIVGAVGAAVSKVTVNAGLVSVVVAEAVADVTLVAVSP